MIEDKKKKVDKEVDDDEIYDLEIDKTETTEDEANANDEKEVDKQAATESEDEKNDEIPDSTDADATSGEAVNDDEVTANEEKKEENVEQRDTESETEKPDNGDAALESIREMVSDLGAERVLELIRDNRNAAIEQILAELKASEENELPLRSGLSVEPKCQSIFDLASFA